MYTSMMWTEWQQAFPQYKLLHEISHLRRSSGHLFWDVKRRTLIAATDVSGQTIGPIFKVQAVQADFLDRLTHEYGTYRLYRNDGHSYQIYVAITSPRTANT
jgi:hypothetical protein